MTSAVMSVEDQNRSLLVRERDGREEEEEEEEEGRSFSWLLLRRKLKRFGVRGAEMERMEREMEKRKTKDEIMTVSKSKETVD